MSALKIHSESLLLCIVVALSAVAVLALSSANKNPINASKFYIYPPEAIKHFTFGYHETMADTLWIRVIQDFDYCENKGDVSVNRGQNLDDIIKADATPSRCHKGWVFQMVDAVTELAPQFRVAHLHGATILSILDDDREGAKIIFDKGVERFPNDWQLTYRAAYHYLFELRQPAKAGELLLKAEKAGGPYWLPLLAARLLSKSGQLELARSVLLDFIEKNPGKSAEQAKKRLDEITKEAEAHP